MRALAAYLLIVAGPVLVLADLAVAVRGGWWTASDLWKVVLGVAVAAVTAATLALGTARGRRALGARLPAVGLALATLGGTWLAAESVVAAAVDSGLWFHRYVPGSQQVFTPFPEFMPGVSGAARHTANSLGIRGPELPAPGAARRVLCVGGSTTACVFLDDGETWPRLLADHLRGRGPCWVGDVGRSGYGTWHHVRLLEDAELIAGMDAVVFLVGINDFMRAVQGRRLLSPLGVKPCWERSAIYTALHNAYQVGKQRRQNLEETADGSVYALRRANRARAERTDVLPDLERGLAEYRANLTTMIARCRELGATPVFATQPVLYRADLPAELERLVWLGGLPDGRTLSVAAMRRGMDRFNAALLEVCARHGVGCVDLAGMSGDAEYFYDDCHFTEAGAAEVARRIGAWWSAAEPR